MNRRVVARNATRGTVLGDRIDTASGLWGRFIGLMGRPSLSVGTGLWLTSTNGIHMMFMRMPIDAVFLSRPDPSGSRTVLSVHRGLRPWIGLVPLIRRADGVLELRSGAALASGTVVGDLVVLEPGADESPSGGS
jgi:uncharacterized protein